MLTWKDYVARGFETTFPLPPNAKFAPPREVTGNFVPPSAEAIEQLWNKAPSNANIGLRMPDGVIALDVDNSDTKHGASHLRQLEAQLGSLNLSGIPRSTKRGPNNPAGHYLFRVPKGKKWEGKACTNVEILQHTHRYSVTAPSVVDGQEYKWYIGTQEIAEPPHIKDLPELPQKWQNYLIKGSARYVKMDNKQPANEEGYRQAIIWLQQYFLEEYDHLTMSRELDLLTDPTEIAPALHESSHDTMTSLVYQVFQLGFEGHVGALTALQRVQAEFVAAATNPAKGDGQRTDAQAKAEFYRSVIDLIPKCQAEIDSGMLVPEYKISLESDGAMIILSKEERERAAQRERAKRLDEVDESDTGPQGVNLDRYSNDDDGHARMLADYWQKDLLVINGGKSETEFALWNKSTKRYELRNRARAAGRITKGITDRIDYEADQLEKRLAAMAEKVSDGQQLDPDDDPDELQGYINGLRQRASANRNVPQQRRIMEKLHSIVDNGYSFISAVLDDFDSKGNVIGLPHGHTLDLDSIESRESTREDMLTKETLAVYQKGITHPAWDRFLDTFVPDPEVREFTQRALGYCLHPENSAKKIFFLLGPSNTGKSVILEACIRALGTYGGAPNAKVIFGNTTAGPSPEIIEASKKRMVIFSELGDTIELNADSIKRMTGVDKMEARRLYSSSLERFTPTFKPYVSTNTAPRIPNADMATKQRIIVIPFEQSHPPLARLPFEQDVINNPEVWPAILSWLVDGYRRYRDLGLSRDTWPLIIRRRTDQMATEASEFSLWSSENLKRDPEGKAFVPYQVVREAWNRAKLESGEKLDTATMLTQNLKREGYKVAQKMVDGHRFKAVIGCTYDPEQE